METSVLALIKQKYWPLGTGDNKKLGLWAGKGRDASAFNLL